jgi:histidinol-phosphate/aromatic aminotransferase/cobyric acid decarboxylase-like protein
MPASGNLSLLNSMSKDFGIAGIRVGYGVMHEDKVRTLLKNGYLWNSNGLAEYFFKLYTRSDFLEQYEEVREKYIREIQEFIEGLRSIAGITVYPTWANFVLIELPKGVKAADVADKLLLRYGIYVRNCDDKIGLEGSFIRVASRTKAENEYILTSLREIFHDGHN